MYINIKNVTYPPACKHTKEMETHHLWIIFLRENVGEFSTSVLVYLQSPILLDKMKDNAIMLDRIC